MPRIFGTIILALAVLLFPPSVLALISNNTVPGDITYPIKIKLEEGIVFLTSVNPQTKIWFSVTRSDRRFQEASVLLSRGEAASQALTELVTQTDVAAAEISQITDQTKKQEFITNLQQSIQKYDDGLAAIQERQIAQTSPPIPMTTSQPAPLSTPASVELQPAPSSKAPTVVPESKPTSAPITPTPTVSPKPQVTSPPAEVKNNEEEIKKAREKLEEIKNKLKKEHENQNINRSSQSKKKEDQQNTSVKEKADPNKSSEK